MPSVRKAIVVGAGIGGLTTAIGLRRNGVEATVVERRFGESRLMSGGGFMIFNNAMLALRELDLDERVAKLGETIHVHEFRNDKGATLARWDLDVQARRMDAPAVALRRADLNRVLLEEAGGAVRMGRRCVGTSQDGDVAAVRFDDGGEEEADVVIGADGLRSSVRESLRHGHEVPPRYSGYTAWQAITELPEEDVPSGAFLNLWGSGGLRFLYCRLNAREVYWDAIVSDRAGARHDMLSVTKREAMARSYSSWPDPVPRLIAATDEDAILPVSIYDRPPAPGRRWGRGRVTLVGDAAHPMTLNLSQGAGQAIEDGVALSRALARVRTAADVPGTIEEYERSRSRRVAVLTDRSFIIGRMGLIHNPLLCMARDAFMRLAFDGPIQRKTNELIADTRF